MTSNDPASAPTTTPAIPRVGSSASHGKTILIGEHAVVYGAPALVLPVTDVRVTATASPLPADDEHTLESTVHTGPLGLAPAAVLPTVTAVTATLRHLARHGHADAEGTPLHVLVDSQVPTARGMGSSAAVAAAVTAAVADVFGVALDTDTHHELIQECERVAHGRPSGLDARGVVATEPVWFADGVIEPVQVTGRFVFVVADTGVPGHTREAVAAVRGRHDRAPRRGRRRRGPDRLARHDRAGGHSATATPRPWVPPWTPRTNCSPPSTCRVRTSTGSSAPHGRRTPWARSSPAVAAADAS
ncbi:hypothetical protein DEJ36_06205 [Curtobacterium sp. MCPF17_052]|nr:hypothetical protein [Curtobacterium sp. MCPF17_052]WIB13403.1 hypothetical protein DEJ36_06205 [Curtobacterium sp. MCPF17_052]